MASKSQRGRIPTAHEVSLAQLLQHAAAEQSFHSAAVTGMWASQAEPSTNADQSKDAKSPDIVKGEASDLAWFKDSMGSGAIAQNIVQPEQVGSRLFANRAQPEIKRKQETSLREHFSQVSAHAMQGTDLAFGQQAFEAPALQVPHRPDCVCCQCAMPLTYRVLLSSYASAMRCPIPTWRIVLPGLRYQCPKRLLRSFPAGLSSRRP
eukprot:3308629-Rhodomonas_salina.1